MKLALIIAAIRANRFRVTDHADEEAAADRLRLDQIVFSVEHGEIIEDYPTDRPYPSCLVYGRDHEDEPVHSVWAYNAATEWAALVTVYRPAADRWIDSQRRRPK